MLVYKNLEDVKILVVGDLMLDRYIIGHKTRVSPEANVDIIRTDEVIEKVGGAANVAMACKNLGVGTVKLFGYYSDDMNGHILRRELEKSGVDISMLFQIKGKTTTKTRIIEDGKQICRLDDEDIHQDISYTSGELKALALECQEVDAIIISDYNKGVVTASLLDAVQGYRTFLDPKPEHKSLYKDRIFQVIKPNLSELFFLSPASSEIESAVSLALEMNCNIVVTKGMKGALLVDENIIKHPFDEKFVKSIPGYAVDVVDTIGAGDVFIATLATIWSVTEGNLVDALKVANQAASISVENEYTYNPTYEEIFRRYPSYLME